MHRSEILYRMSRAAGRIDEPVIQQPLLELCGEHRVLIEHHRGILEYSHNAVSVKVSFGVILIEGTGLEICKMMKDQLVIIGDIHMVSLQTGRIK